MTKTVCERDKCTGCKACLEICPKSALTFEDTASAMNVLINENKCIECAFATDIMETGMG